ncbi:MAG: hypothetical protein WDM87_14155 [Terracidiphilus sp.]
MGPALLAAGRDKGTHGVFIVGADFSEVAGLAELNVQHMRRQYSFL